MKRQGYNDRLDERLGMKDGRESSKKQSYKDRRDESRGMSKSKSWGDMGHDKMPHQIDIPCGQGFSEVKDNTNPGYRVGYSREAYNYEY